MNIIRLFVITALLLLTAAVPANDMPVIRSGCSGGVTGGGSGYEIRRDGAISSWRKDSWKSVPESTLIRSDRPAADGLFALFESAGFIQIEHNEPGNMTCFLTFESADKSHTVSWSHKPPQPVRELYDAVSVIATGKPAAAPGELTVIETIPPPATKLKLEETLPAPTGSL